MKQTPEKAGQRPTPQSAGPAPAAFSQRQGSPLSDTAGAERLRAGSPPPAANATPRQGETLSDLREGVTPFQHAVLDLAEGYAKWPSSTATIEDQLGSAMRWVQFASLAGTPQGQLPHVMNAAADLLMIGERLHREIDALPEGEAA